MAQKFVNRKNDLATLQQQYERNDASFVVVYGRRRIGKTTLLTKFMEGKPALYFLATEESEMQNLDAFRSMAAAFLQDSLLASAKVDRWEPVFERLAEEAAHSKERFLIIIDEFQYLGKANAAFPSIFQRIWDSLLKPLNVMVVVCGSLLSLMNSQVLSESSPLYGRRTAQVHMRQIPYDCYGEFFDNRLSQRELINRYSVTGGVPKYVEAFEGKGSIYKLIRQNVLNQNGFLFNEPYFLLSKEVNEIGSYFSIIKAIANGSHRLGEIAARLSVKSTSLTRYLKTLEDLDIVEREVPVTEDNPIKSKKGLYRLKDNYLRFWFRFVFPYMGLLETDRTEVVAQKIEQNLVDGLVSFVFEDICRERVWTLAQEGDLPFIPERVGRWWGAGDVEIDVLALSSKENIAAFGECKFWKTPVGVNVLREVESKAQAVKWHNDKRQNLFMLFSISGYTEELQKEAELRSDVVLWCPEAS